MSERKLASIQVVEEIGPIDGADAIEVAKVLGWRCVVKKGEFSPGDRCVYFEIDSMVPKDVPALAFMEKQRWRVKTIKIRGQLSQGLAVPLTAFPWLAGKAVGEDVSSMIGSGVTKWEPDVHHSLTGEARGSFPGFIRKTDEPRIQSCPGMLHRHRDALWYCTEKLDGTSFTAYYYREDFGVCSRNLNLKPESADGNDTRNAHWRAAKAYGLGTSLPNLCKALNRDLAVQGEIIGPKIQGNKYGRDGLELYVFGVYDIEAGAYVDLREMLGIAEALRLKTVPVIATDIPLADVSVDSIVAAAGGESVLAPIPREGVVYRTMAYEADDRHGHASFKAISNEFLLKHKA